MLLSQITTLLPSMSFVPHPTETPPTSIGDTLSWFETIFKDFPLTQEFLLIFVSILLGALSTVFINNRAMRRQCKFNLVHDLLKAEKERVKAAHDAIKSLEISLSFRKLEHPEYKSKIDNCSFMLHDINKHLREQLPITYKYISASMVEYSAQLVSDYFPIFYHFGENGITDIQLNQSVSSEQLEALRSLTFKVNKMYNDFVNAEEKLISPGFLSALVRRLRPIQRITRDIRGILSNKAKTRKQE